MLLRHESNREGQRLWTSGQDIVVTVADMEREKGRSKACDMQIARIMSEFSEVRLRVCINDVLHEWILYHVFVRA